MTDRSDRPDREATPADLPGPGDTIDPDAHPAHLEEWRSDAVPPSDVDEEAIIDEDSPATIQTDRGDTIVVPDEDRPVDLADDGLADDALVDDGFTDEESIEDGFVEEQ
ncbi:hypothetical protein ELQ90_05175 [Labedella phragmitis]|uniref:Uncharacterized protein n=1 Tax=Labedella phragmitis TaxID=2498849 RepID=A0A3S4A4X0_9MICO|nr:hypothetical protein [Labedella phragmitis]RWZ51508.1 hypothetical protein ELQ90_05175 [Labedella phragmitis]